MTTIKLCRDCRHSVVVRGLPDLRCSNPQVIGLDPRALGSATATHVSAAAERAEPWPFGACGRRGALWEERK